MKYIVDLDDFKKCLDLIEKPAQINGEALVKLESVKMLIDAFPKKKIKEEIKESSGSKYKGVFVVENMPMQYRPMFESLSEKQQDEIICRARMYDFTKPNALESFWANQDFNVTRIVESANENVNKEPVVNPAANNVISSMRKMLHIV